MAGLHRRVTSPHQADILLTALVRSNRQLGICVRFERSKLAIIRSSEYLLLGVYADWHKRKRGVWENLIYTSRFTSKCAMYSPANILVGTGENKRRKNVSLKYETRSVYRICELSFHQIETRKYVTNS